MPYPVSAARGKNFGSVIPAPDAPTGLTATPASLTQINLAWTDNATDETGYKVYRSTDAETYALLDTIAADLEAYSDTTVLQDIIYYYKVAAYNAGGESESNPAGAGTLQPDETTGLDTYLNQGQLTRNYGLSVTLRSGKIVDNTRGLLMFSGLTGIPSDATVAAASLTLYCESESATTDRVVGVHRALTQWYEGNSANADPGAGEDASTWNLRNANGSVAWAGGAGGASGSDWTATATDTKDITAPSAAYTWNVQADLAAWVAGSASNYGWWLINVGEAVSNSQKVFTPTNGATTANRPKLVLQVNPT